MSDRLESFNLWMWSILGIVAGAGILVFLGNLIFSPTYVDFCYVEQNVGEHRCDKTALFVLKGHRDWSSPPGAFTIGEFGTLDDAAAAARKLGCPLLKH